MQIFATALATPFEVTGAAFHNGNAYLRIEGLEKQLLYRQSRLLDLLSAHTPQVLDAEATVALWRNLRDVGHFAGADLPLWRILAKPSDAPQIARHLQNLGGQTSLDWGGGLIWYAGPGTVQQVRTFAPHATLIRRAGLTGPAFPPQSGAAARLQTGLRQTFDPAGILNPGLMDA